MDRSQDSVEGIPPLLSGTSSGQRCAGTGRPCHGGGSVWLAGILAVSLLIVAGLTFRVAVAKFSWEIGEPVKLPVPLSEIPLQIGGWRGTKLEIPAVTDSYLRTNFADDYVSRRYMHSAASLWADVYVVYCSSRPAGILGHQPMVCFPAHGWIHEESAPSQIISESGRSIPCLVHRFHDPQTYRQVVVLAFYVLNGQITVSEKEFSGILGRRPNIAGDPARYVAQVQISTSFPLVESSERSVKTAASELVDTILAFLPDKDGRVAAADSAGK